MKNAWLVPIYLDGKQISKKKSCLLLPKNKIGYEESIEHVTSGDLLDRIVWSGTQSAILMSPQIVLDAFESPDR